MYAGDNVLNYDSDVTTFSTKPHQVNTTLHTHTWQTDDLMLKYLEICYDKFIIPGILGKLSINMHYYDALKEK